MKETFFVLRDGDLYLATENAKQLYSNPIRYTIRYSKIEDAEKGKEHIQKTLGRLLTIERIDLEYTVTKLIN